MRRRTVLRSAAVAGEAALAGCLSGSALSDERTASPQSTPSETSSETRPNADPNTTANKSPPAQVTVTLTIENQTTHSRSGSVYITHIQEPSCRYNEKYQCEIPTQQHVALDASFTLNTGEIRRFDPVRMKIDGGTKEDENSYVDKYIIEVNPDETQGRRLAGLEAGAASIMGREDAGAIPWRVVGREYHMHTLLLSDSVEIAPRIAV